MAKWDRCCARVSYETMNSIRVTSNGEKRYNHGSRCLKPASFVDADGDGWCWIHARNLNNANIYGPFKAIDKTPRIDQ